MGIENKKIVEKSEEEDLRRQSATSLGFKGKLTNDPFDLHGEICNLCISKNPKSMIDLNVELTVKKIKMYILSLFVKRVEEGKSIFWSKLYFQLKECLSSLFTKPKGSNDIEMQNLKTGSFEIGCEATEVDIPINANDRISTELKDIIGLQEQSDESYESSEDLSDELQSYLQKRDILCYSSSEDIFDDYETDDGEGTIELSKKVLVEPSYMESVFLVDSKDSTKSNLAMFRIKGLSGDDKNKLINGIQSDWSPDRNDNFANFVTCSTYDYLIVNGDCNSDITQIQTAHRYFENQLSQSIMYKTRVVVNDNQN